MPDRNWANIANGSEFEALATTLIFFENPGVKLFGRPGKHGGRDARSGDGTRVFEAKHHQDASAAQAIRGAKKEAEKVAECRPPGRCLARSNRTEPENA